ncbi:MAG TPA: hypothetical protein VGM90_10665 [Kofleriaceae bacterium]|jgi:hypothetical protein
MGRHARAFAGAILLFGGCAQIAGIDDTTGIVTPPGTASLTLIRTSVGTSIINSALDLTGQSATFLVLDPDAQDGLQRIPAMQTADGVWTANVEAENPAVLFSTPSYPEQTLSILELPFKDTKQMFREYEHPGRTVAVTPEASMLTVNATLPSPFVATETFQLATIGAWGKRGLAAPMTLGDTALAPAAFTYDTVSSGNGRPLDKITTADSVLVLRYNSSTLTGVLDGVPFDQTGADTITGTMTAVSTTDQLSVTVNNETVGQRYAPLRPAMPLPNMNWSVVAAPGARIAATAGVNLVGTTITSAAGMGQIGANYLNPFIAKGWGSIFIWSTNSFRAFTPDGAPGPASLLAALYQLAAPRDNLTLDMPVGMPESISLDGTPLSSDGITIAKPTSVVTCSFQVPPTPMNTLYRLELYELVPNTATPPTGLDHKIVVDITSDKPTMFIPPEMFADGKTYTIRAIVTAGDYPGVNSGDLSTRELDQAGAIMESGVFTVGTP